MQNNRHFLFAHLETQFVPQLLPVQLADIRSGPDPDGRHVPARVSHVLGSPIGSAGGPCALSRQQLSIFASPFIHNH